MYKVNQLVDHRSSGVCRIQAINALSSDEGAPLYYVITPLFGDEKGTIIRVPVSNDASLSPVMTREEAEDLLSCWPRSGDLYEKDAKKRKDIYAEALRAGNVALLPRLLEGILQRKERDGKLNTMDQQFVNRATPILYGELSVALGIDYGEIESFIHPENNKA